MGDHFWFQPSKGTSSSGGGVAVRAKVSTSATSTGDQVAVFTATVGTRGPRPRPQQRKRKARLGPHQPPTTTRPLGALVVSSGGLGGTGVPAGSGEGRGRNGELRFLMQRSGNQPWWFATSYLKRCFTCAGMSNTTWSSISYPNRWLMLVWKVVNWIAWNCNINLTTLQSTSIDWTNGNGSHQSFHSALALWRVSCSPVAYIHRASLAHVQQIQYIQQTRTRPLSKPEFAGTRWKKVRSITCQSKSAEIEVSDVKVCICKYCSIPSYSSGCYLRCLF